jgi:hypothetical protein
VSKELGDLTSDVLPVVATKNGAQRNADVIWAR